MSRRKRPLRPEELELWRQVAGSAEPLKKRDRAVPAPAKPETIPPRNVAAAPAAPPQPEARWPEFTLGQKAAPKRAAHDLAASLSQRMARAPVQMDAKQHARLKRGKLRPEARIDLHGMTLEEAHPALTGFILQSHAMGRRLVLVITGKGRPDDGQGPMPRPRGVLRHQVPQWLKMAPLRGIVLQVSEAHIRHGGSGAFYVYLRRG